MSIEINHTLFVDTGPIIFAGPIRNIYFPFDIETDTALTVATEMVAELDITDQDVTRIADMLDGEIASLVPEWKSGPGIEETPLFANQNSCGNCFSNHTSGVSLLEFLSTDPGTKDMRVLQCCKHGCASMHGRFGEITFQAVEDKNLHYQEIWGQYESQEISSVGSGQSHSDKEEYATPHQSIMSLEDIKLDSINVNCPRSSSVPITCSDLSENCEKEIQQELRWLKAKYQMELRELIDQQLGLVPNYSNHGSREQGLDNKSFSYLGSNVSQEDNQILLKSSVCDYTEKSCPGSVTQRDRNCEATESLNGNEMKSTARIFNTGSLLPHSLHRTASLPVDAVDM